MLFCCATHADHRRYGEPTYFFRRLLEEATQPPPASVSSTRDKLNGMRRVKRQVGAKETKDKLGVPNGFISHFTSRMEGIIVPFSGIIKLAA
jgi:hypothetical protein